MEREQLPHPFQFCSSSTWLWFLGWGNKVCRPCCSKHAATLSWDIVLLLLLSSSYENHAFTCICCNKGYFLLTILYFNVISVLHGRLFSPGVHYQGDSECVYVDFSISVLRLGCTQRNLHIHISIYMINISSPVSDLCRRPWCSFLTAQTAAIYKSKKNETTAAYCGFSTFKC